MKLLSLSFAAIAFAALGTSARADLIPYCTPGQVAPAVSVFANSSSGIKAYFAGSDAGFDDLVQVTDLSNGFVSSVFFPGHETVLGSELTIGAGSIQAGDQLLFSIISPQGTFGSLNGCQYSADCVNHAYITAYSGGTVGGTAVPAGLYVGLEDESILSGSDLDYNDDSLIFDSSVSVTPPTVTPEPESLALVGTGLLSVVGIARRKLRNR